MIFQFGVCELDVARAELRRGGKVQPVEPQVFELLVYLVKSRDRVVSRDELNDAIWAGRIVTDAALNSCIKAARDAIGDDGRTQLCIRTKYRKGYRFVAAVSEIRTAPPASRAGTGATDDRARTANDDRPPLPQGDPTPDRKPSLGERRSLLLVAAVLVVLALAGTWWMQSPTPPGVSQKGASGPASATPLAVAVLPFVNLSADEDAQYLADGLSAELIDFLAKTLGIRVIAPTSSFSFRDFNVGVATITEQFDVTHVLEGSVRRAGDRIRITAQLIEARTGSHLWSDTYELAETFTVQDDIGAAVARTLALQFPATATAGEMRTPDTRAYEAYLRGQYLFQRRSTGDLLRSLQHFEEAVRVDPNFALAWAGIAGAYFVLQYDGIVPESDAMAKRGESIANALALGPDQAVVQARASHYYRDSGQYLLARQHMREAIALEPNNLLVLGYLARMAAWHGDFVRAAELGARALARDPLSAATVGNLVAYLMADGRVREAEAELQKVGDIIGQLPEDLQKHLINVCIVSGRYKEALVLLERLPEDADRLQRLAIILFALGRTEEADRALVEMAGISGTEGEVRRAEVLAFRGEIDACFEELETLRSTAEKVHDVAAPTRHWAFLARVSPYLNRLDDPRWQAIWGDTEETAEAVSRIERPAENPHCGRQCRRQIARASAPARVVLGARGRRNGFDPF